MFYKKAYPPSEIQHVDIAHPLIGEIWPIITTRSTKTTLKNHVPRSFVFNKPYEYI